MLPRVLPAGPGLKEFMRGQRTLGMYRAMLRSAKRIREDQLRHEIWTRIRSEFRANMNETDPLKIQMLLADVRHHADHLEAMAATQPLSNANAGGSRVTSWMDIDDPDDKRGRLGVSFPWER